MGDAPIDLSKVPRRSPWSRGKRSVVWTEDEDAAVIQRHTLRTETADSLSARLGKSKSAIYRRAIDLGCQRDGKRWPRGRRRGDHYLDREKFHPNARPIVIRVYNIVKHQRMSLEELASRSGVSRYTIVGWGYRMAVRHEPNLFNFEAVINALGYEIQIVKRQKRRR